MIAEIKKSTAAGKINAPTSKSMAHRLLISAAMAEGDSIIRGVTPSEDALATIDCLTALGAKIELRDDAYFIRGFDIKNSLSGNILKCRESGSTLRFIIPIAALSKNEVTLLGSKRLFERPLGVYEKIFHDSNLKFEKGNESLTIKGPLTSGNYTVRGDISSQFISGLLFALPTLEGESRINIIPLFESRSYVELTLAALKKFGIEAYFDGELTIKIPGNQKYTPTEATVEGDYSGAAFLEAFNMLGSDIEILGLDPKSLQGDKAYLDLYPKIKNGCPTIDIGDCPDLAPILFTLAAYFNGATFLSTSRLRAKECDRAEAMAKELKKCGAKIHVLDDSVIIEKSKLHSPEITLSGHNDHRVVMALSVLLSVLGGKIDDAEAIKKSYPDFFRDVKNAGIEVTLYD